VRAVDAHNCLARRQLRTLNLATGVREDPPDGHWRGVVRAMYARGPRARGRLLPSAVAELRAALGLHRAHAAALAAERDTIKRELAVLNGSSGAFFCLLCAVFGCCTRVFLHEQTHTHHPHTRPHTPKIRSAAAGRLHQGHRRRHGAAVRAAAHEA
jgi:hypothetical protein